MTGGLIAGLEVTLNLLAHCSRYNGVPLHVPCKVTTTLTLPVQQNKLNLYQFHIMCVFNVN